MHSRNGNLCSKCSGFRRGVRGDKEEAFGETKEGDEVEKWRGGSGRRH